MLIKMKYKESSKPFWGQHLWARGYFVARSGNVTDEIIGEYIINQDMEDKMKSDNFDIAKL
ncbi:MAG: transposase [Lachnotalea sp.]